MVIEKKWDRLREMLRGMNGAVVAFSGGVDSSVLLKAASEVMGPHLLAVTAASATYPEQELHSAQKFAQSLGVPHSVLHTGELASKTFTQNTPDRCYHCKKELFGKLRQIADERGAFSVLDGSNVDDLSDHRPGMRAAKEYGVRSPLMEAGFGKAELRAIAARLNLPMWNKPSLACLASRIPYGTPITPEMLRTIGIAENHLRRFGFLQVRARYHGDIVRIELGREEFDRILEKDTAQTIAALLKELGFTYVCLDLEGYRTGSMNEVMVRMQKAECGMRHEKA